MPMFIIAFVFSQFYPDAKIWSLIPIFVCTVIAFIASRVVSEMRTRVWYHEIVMCGVDKLSMSITELSRGDSPRSSLHALFEGYFGLLIKFVSPAILLILLFESLAADLEAPYGN